MLTPGDDALHLFASARRLGVPILRAQQIGGVAGARTALEQPQIEDLLIRPTVGIDYDRLERPGAGPSRARNGRRRLIGGELALRCLAFGAGELTIVDQSELGAAQYRGRSRKGKWRQDRDPPVRRRYPRPTAHLQHCAEARPEIVFHAAALKHVPFVEENWTEGVKTNVFGSVNVIDAALRRGEGLRPSSISRPTRRSGPCRYWGRRSGSPRSIRRCSNAEAAERRHRRGLASVRFGNVLGSSGSVGSEVPGADRARRPRHDHPS